MNPLEKNLKIIKYNLIVLSSFSTEGFLGAIITNENICTVVAGFLSSVLFAFNLFFKNLNLENEMKQHFLAIDELWFIREKYISLMTDFDILSTEDIISTRDILLKNYEIYKKTPKINSKSYTEAQEALKNEEEQFFTNEKID